MQCEQLSQRLAVCTADGAYLVHARQGTAAKTMATIPKLRKALAATGFHVYMQVSSWYKPTQYFVTDMRQPGWPIVLLGADKEAFRTWAVDQIGQ